MNQKSRCLQLSTLKHSLSTIKLNKLHSGEMKISLSVLNTLFVVLARNTSKYHYRTH